MAGHNDLAADRRRVLIVDDEADIAEILAEIVMGEGHLVEVAANGRDALARIRASAFDLILSDLIMPELDGPGFWRALRSTAPQMLTRIVFITGDTLGEPAQRFLSEANRPVIEKPFVPDEVRRVLRCELAAGASTGACGTASGGMPRR
ncbi:MAG: response regulator [Rhodospirillales bacterium]|nr:response regulator [Rhodospirillales bacterium]